MNEKVMPFRVMPGALIDTCAVCKWYKGNPVVGELQPQGLCMRMPPVPFPLPGQSGGVNVMSIRPPVKGIEAACGEYRFEGAK